MNRTSTIVATLLLVCMGSGSAESKTEEKKKSVPVVKSLTAKQRDIQRTFLECMKFSTPIDRINSVTKYVFDEQAKLESQGGWRKIFQSRRGSSTHHGREICLARAYGLKGYGSLDMITSETGKSLVPVSSPHVEIAEDEIPPDRRLVREWTRDYVLNLAERMHEYTFKKKGVLVTFSPLRTTSMIRTLEDQNTLARAGLSPADCNYRFLCSTHTSGSAIDFGNKDASKEQKEWLQKELISDQKARKIYFIIEKSHFHVFVIPPRFMDEE